MLILQNKSKFEINLGSLQRRSVKSLTRSQFFPVTTRLFINVIFTFLNYLINFVSSVASNCLYSCCLHILTKHPALCEYIADCLLSPHEISLASRQERSLRNKHANKNGSLIQDY